MKNIKIKNTGKSIVLTGLILFTSLFFQSCAEKMTFLNSSVVPSAEGSVKIKKDNNNNYAIDLTMMRLADPQRLTPSKSIYVVWMNTERDGTKNIGQVKTSSGMFSSTLRSSFKTVTSFKPVGFFITAEDDSNVQQASGQVVIKTFSSN